MLKRRDFLKSTGYFVAAAGLASSASGCGDDSDPVGTFLFSQGVASGDPRESSVVLWTRVERASGNADPIDVRVAVSEVEDFSTVVLEQTLTVTEDSDHTLRLLVTELSPATRYFYRFKVSSDTIEGRTLTAPGAGDTAAVNFSWASCQDFGPGTFSAYREMIKDDEARAEADQIQFVIHVGDFIYETLNDEFQRALDDNFEFFDITDDEGNLIRRLPDFPDGATTAGETHAVTLADYRHLYKEFLRDPDLQAARARWPFIQTWDDHEFTNDCWQTQANYVDNETLDEGAQERKLAANQAWFEFIPANLSDAEGVPGVTQHASDFASADVSNAPLDNFDDNLFSQEPNNVAAVESMTIYRSIRWGKNVELVITDERSYRSDHPLDEELTFNNPLFFAQRNALPIDPVIAFDAGREANGGNPEATVGGFPNTRIDSPPGTMLGAQQRQWWKDTMMGSDANWKVWGNQVPLMRVMAKNEPAGILLSDRIYNGDGWDAYNFERNELMQFLLDNSIENVVVLTGDVHAHFAGHVMDDHEAVTPVPVVAEFETAGISSNTLFSFLLLAVREQPQQLKDLISYDSTGLGGDTAFENNANVLFYYGTAAALEAASSNSLPAIEAADDPEVNPWLRFVDTRANGYGLVTATDSRMTVTLVTVNAPTNVTGETGVGIKGTATFTLDKDDVNSLSGPTFSGTIPFPFT